MDETFGIAGLFPVAPKARADLTPGALYAIGCATGSIYYGQVAPNKQMGFFRYRSNKVDPGSAYASKVMSRFDVNLPSVGHALRTGHWLALGRRAVHPELLDEPILVQWPVGTTQVTLWRGSEVIGQTIVSDPAIQQLEIIAAYDAVTHVPQRLQAEYEQSPDSWRVGGTVRQHRLLKEDSARRFPDQPWHQLPKDWVRVDDV